MCSIPYHWRPLSPPCLCVKVWGRAGRMRIWHGSSRCWCVSWVSLVFIFHSIDFQAEPWFPLWFWENQCTVWRRIRLYLDCLVHGTWFPLMRLCRLVINWTPFDWGIKAFQHPLVRVGLVCPLYPSPSTPCFAGCRCRTRSLLVASTMRWKRILRFSTRAVPFFSPWERLPDAEERYFCATWSWFPKAAQLLSFLYTKRAWRHRNSPWIWFDQPCRNEEAWFHSTVKRSFFATILYLYLLDPFHCIRDISVDPMVARSIVFLFVAGTSILRSLGWVGFLGEMDDRTCSIAFRACSMEWRRFRRRFPCSRSSGRLKRFRRRQRKCNIECLLEWCWWEWNVS